ncbi:hypothetical protein ACFQZS_04225 [Mucilaginibacter calamicampi]|uniref:Uncharacterized protein n=1 Tax=Mucilaginibacter calamicampi TaxID=1302352 RepID=A0ABW2YSD6_9SPHI
MRKTVLLTLIVLAAATATNAQKLPNVQKESLRAPVNIKIDGKATEWDNKFKAQNSATELLYTLSNDDENLYLTVQTKFKDVIDKIMRGGITLNVNSTIDRKSGNQISLTYPSFDQAGASKVTNMLVVKNYPKANLDEEPVSIDNLNKAFASQSKVIDVKGINGIPNGEVSIYNENGIQVAAHFDDEYGYTCELAIPVKYLSLPDNGSKPFSYQLKVNEPKQFSPKAGNRPPPPMKMTSVAATDTWGEYTLAKK